MMIMKTLNLAICFILLASISHAGWTDGNRLQQSCTAIGRYDTGYCHGFLSAAATVAIERIYCEKMVDGEKTYTFGTKDECENPLQIDIPGNLQLAQVLDIVLKYLNDNPAELHNPAEISVEQALFKSFGLREFKKAPAL
jgi:hypothetical protein